MLGETLFRQNMFDMKCENGYYAIIPLGPCVSLAPGRLCTRDSFFIGGPSIKNRPVDAAHFYLKLKEKQFRTSMFPDEIDLGSGQRLKRATKWE